jgi:hypothetical protein
VINSSNDARYSKFSLGQKRDDQIDFVVTGCSHDDIAFKKSSLFKCADLAGIAHKDFGAFDHAWSRQCGIPVNE